MGGVIKKRVGVANRGKSSGDRTILAYKSGKHTFFMFGFLKNQTDNITPQELKAVKTMAKEYFSYNESQIEKATWYIQDRFDNLGYANIFDAIKTVSFLLKLNLF